MEINAAKWREFEPINLVRGGVLTRPNVSTYIYDAVCIERAGNGNLHAYAGEVDINSYDKNELRSFANNMGFDIVRTSKQDLAAIVAFTDRELVLREYWDENKLREFLNENKYLNIDETPRWEETSNYHIYARQCYDTKTFAPLDEYEVLEKNNMGKGNLYRVNILDIDPRIHDSIIEVCRENDTERDGAYLDEIKGEEYASAVICYYNGNDNPAIRMIARNISIADVSKILNGADITKTLGTRNKYEREM